METRLLKTLILTIVLVGSFAAGYEWYWRSKGFTISYNDDKVLWARHRKEVYKPKDQSTILIGSSRIKFDVDVATWKDLTGEKAIQLSLPGTPPHPILHHLANDENFKGKLIIDVMELQFFAVDRVRREKSAREAIDYYLNETPAQKIGASINHSLESKLVFLEEGLFGLTRLLDDLQISNRPGVNGAPEMLKEFRTLSFDRQGFLTPTFLSDTLLQKKQIANRRKVGSLSKRPTIKNDTLAALFKELKTSIDKIKNRGGQVVFIRPPSSGGDLEIENRVNPRSAYWDALLEYTRTSGIHFLDYAETANLVCVDGSHLAPNDAVIYTKQLIKTLQEEKGWLFTKTAVTNPTPVGSRSSPCCHYLNFKLPFLLKKLTHNHCRCRSIGAHIFHS
jgi:hypothetical protein